ncbi:MAG: cache domain-containing protein [Marinibacterium sp.]
MKSLGVILALALAGLQLFAVTVVVFTSYFTSENALLQNARNQLFDVGTNVIKHTESFLTPARSAAELSTALAENRFVQREQTTLLEGLMFEQLRVAPQFAGVYYGDEDGNFVYVRHAGDGTFETKLIDVTAEPRTTLIDRNDNFGLIRKTTDPEDDFDPRVRPWYRAAKAARASIWTDPYIFFTSKSPGITAATPVIDSDGRVQGAVGVDIEIKELSSFLEGMRIGQHGAAFILNRNGDVIAHPDPSLLTRAGEGGMLKFPSIREIEDPIARAAFADRLTNSGVDISEAINSDFVHDGTTFVSLILPFGLGDVPWTIVLYAPEDDFIGSIKKNRTQNTLIAVAIAGLTGLLGLALANRIHAPVRAFAVRSALISQGEIDPNAPMPKTYRELENANTALVNEISQRKRTETEYRLTFDMASRGMVSIDVETGKILRVNEKFAQLLGRPESELIGVVFQTLLHPDEPDVLNEFGESIVNHSAFRFEARALRQNGDPVWISFNGVVFQDDAAGHDHIVATIDDLTGEKASAEQIEALNREIAHFSRQQVMGELATGLAHELNQPLTAITQNADAAQSLAAANRDCTPEVLGLLSEIDQQAHQAGDIVRALRGFIRKEGNRPSDFGLRELLEQARRLVLSEARQHGVDIVVQKGKEVRIGAVRVQIAQVVVNLLRNAIEAMAAGDRPVKRVVVSVSRTNGVVQIDIVDTGPGIADGVDVFAQFETTKASGMGLGLSISRTLIESNGGRIWCRSSPDGARFSFTLPVKDPSA